MVTINKEELKKVEGNNQYILVELSGLAADDKPTTINGSIIDNGSVYIAVDTGDVYLYDLENEEWTKI